MSLSKDPLQALFQLNPPHSSSVKRIVCGSKYLLLETIDHKAGVAGSPGHEYTPQYAFPNSWDLENPSHRQLLTAWNNATLNIENQGNSPENLEYHISSQKWNECVMIGYFKPLYKRLTALGVKVYPFDLEKDDPEVYPQGELMSMLSTTRNIITTPLIFINNTWKDIFEGIGEGYNIVLTGPSVTYHEVFMQMEGVSGLYGSTIPNVTDELIELVMTGGGMQAFKHLLNKSSM